MQLDLHQLRELLTAIDQPNISELTLKSGDLELVVRKGTLLSDRHSLPSSNQNDTISESISPTVATLETIATQKNTVMSPVAPPTASSKFEEILSPVVGTFFRSPNPDEAPFVEVGDEITSGQTVCIIEAMKVMNEIEAEVSGQIVKILIKNGEPVEYNQPLMLVNLN